MRQLFAGGDFDSLTYRVENQNGRNVVDVMPIERNIGPNYLRFGLNLKSSTTGDSTFTFLGSHLRTWVNSAGGSWRNDLQLGSDKLFHTEFYQPLGVDNPVFVAAQAGYKESAWPFFNQQHALEKVLMGSGECAVVDWRFLGMAMPFWVGVFFVLVILFTLFQQRCRSLHRY